MIAFLLILLMVQGIPALPGQSGTVSGIVRTSAGLPAAGVRVSAMVAPESGTDVAYAAAFSALAQTDEEGRYRLERIPTGRYYIVAGRVDLPTFYPGTADMSQARVFSITQGGAVSGIDFVIVDTSIRTASLQNSYGASQSTVAIFPIPTHIHLEGGVKLPVFAAGDFTMVRSVELGSGLKGSRLIKNSFTLNLLLPVAAPEYRISVENLPEGYVVKSMTYGSSDITNSLKIPPALLPRPTITTVNGVTQSTVASVQPAVQTMPELNITLAMLPVQETSGVRVTGRVKDTEVRPIYISGSAGTLFSDGTFEFRGVPPGRHIVGALGTSMVSSLGASIVVGDHNMEGVELEPVALLPLDVKQPTTPGPAGAHAPGFSLPLVSFRGRLLEQASGEPIEEGTIRLIGRDQSIASVVNVGSGGQFQFLRLLPGTYEIEVRIFGHSYVPQTVVVGDEDLRMDVRTLRRF